MISYFAITVLFFSLLLAGRKIIVKRHLHGHDFRRQCFPALIYTLESKFDT